MLGLVPALSEGAVDLETGWSTCGLCLAWAVLELSVEKCAVPGAEERLTLRAIATVAQPHPLATKFV